MSSGLPYPIYPGDDTRQQGNIYPPYPYPQQPTSGPASQYPPYQQTPYPPSNPGYPPGPTNHQYPGQPQPGYLPYPGSAPAGQAPYPVDQTGGFPMPAYNPYPADPVAAPYPPSAPPYNPGSGYPVPMTDSSKTQNVNEGKFGSGLVNRALNAGMTMANDALNKNLPQFGGHRPQQPPPSSGYDTTDGNCFGKTATTSHATPSRGMRKFANQDYESLKRGCLSRGTLFEDSSFRASSRLLVDEKSQFIVSYFGRSSIDASSIEWLRPKEICQKLNLRQGPKMFVGKIDRFDINQGEIGNCWFLAALANLAENKSCFFQVVPPDQDFDKNYAGIFRFRFWRFGEWEEVVVDDLLPTRRGQLIYLRSVEKNEFWGALLEKAYAKLHGSYRALEGGLTIEAAVDFTGGIPEMIELQNSRMPPEKIFYLMSRAADAKAFMGCALANSSRAREAQQLGLQSRHAYTITKVVEIRSHKVQSGIPLVRIRNPHGNSKEWRGDWSDDDRNWQMIPTHMRAQLGLTFEDDGEFYMSFRDFMKYFGELEICHLNPEALDLKDNHKKFEVFHFFGSWIPGSSAGGCGNDGHRSFATNPQFFINLSDPDPYDDERHCPVVISLLQQQEKRKSEHAIGFKVYKCDLTAKSLNESFFSRSTPVDRIDSFINLREVSKRLVLPPGRYCIVPCTFHRNEQGDFLLRVFVQKQWGSSEIARAKAVHQVGPSDVTDGMRNIHISPAPPSGPGFGGPGFGPAPPMPSSSGYMDSLPSSLKKNRIAGFALKKLEEQFPTGMKNLNTFFNWAKDRESEYGILKNIVQSLQGKPR